MSQTYLSGRTRYRVIGLLFKKLVLQVEETWETSLKDGPKSTYWRDAKTEDLSELNDLEREHIQQGQYGKLYEVK